MSHEGQGVVNSYAAILFDLDDTLLDRRRTVERYLADHAARMRLSSDVASAYRALFHEIDENGHASRASVFDRLGAEFPTVGSADALLKDFLEYGFATCDWVEGATHLLAWCRSSGLRSGIITNGSSAMQRAKLRALDLAALVDVILVSEEEGVSKPAAEIFHRAASRLGVRPDECVFIGDNPMADVDGSRRAGMMDVWVRRGFEWPSGLAPASRSIATLADLPRLLELSANSWSPNGDARTAP